MARTTPTYTPIGKYAFASLISVVLLIADLNYGTFSTVRGFFKASAIYTQLITESFFDGLKNSILLLQDNKILIRSNNNLRNQLLQVSTRDFIQNEIKTLSIDLQNLKIELRDLVGNADIEIFQIASFDLKNYLCCSYHQLYFKNPKKLIVANNSPVAIGSAFVGQTTGRDLNLIKAILFSDIRHILPIKVQDFYCNAKGTGKPLLISCIISDSATIVITQEGDNVFTSGLGGIFPKSVLIGEVDSINKISTESYEILIRLKTNPLDANFFGVMLSL